MIRFFSALIEAFKWERLDEIPPPEKTAGTPSFLKWLAAPEKLPRPSVSVPPDKTSMLKWLLLPEKLPAADSPAPNEERSSLFTILFSSETLPLDPAPGTPGGPARRKGRRSSGKGRDNYPSRQK